MAVSRMRSPTTPKSANVRNPKRCICEIFDCISGVVIQVCWVIARFQWQSSRKQLTKLKYLLSLALTSSKLSLLLWISSTKRMEYYGWVINEAIALNLENGEYSQEKIALVIFSFNLNLWENNTFRDWQKATTYHYHHLCGDYLPRGAPLLLEKGRNIGAVTVSQSCIFVRVFYGTKSLAECPEQIIFLILLHSTSFV